MTQSFFSLSVGFGSLTTYASFNKFRHPTSRDALIISFADTFTSLLAGTVIFAILGHLAHETGQEVEDVVKSSAGLAFISYPEVLASFPASNFFSVVFFLMLITLGLGSAIGLLSSVTTTLTDSFPTIDKKTIIKLCCAVGFAIGVFYVTPGGMLMLDMVDHYGGTMLILGLASLEVIGIAWVYGTNVVTRDFDLLGLLWCRMNASWNSACDNDVTNESWHYYFDMGNILFCLCSGHLSPFQCHLKRLLCGQCSQGGWIHLQITDLCQKKLDTTLVLKNLFSQSNLLRL